jgi:hypothetical protein
MGKIEEVENGVVKIRCFDGCARWLEDSVSVDVGSITMLTFLDRYSTILSKYTEKQ